MSMQHAHGDDVAVRANDNLTTVLWERAAAHDPNDAFRYWRDGAWRGMTWVEAAERVRDIAAGLVALGVAPGDRVALLSDTRIEWTLADLAILAAGAVTVPIDPAAAAEQSAGILAACDARAVITATAEQASRLTGRPAAADIFVLDAAGLDQIAARGDDDARIQVADRVAQTGGGDVATITARGALTHDDLLAATRQSAQRLRLLLRRSDTVLVCTPLAHDFAHRLQLMCLGANVTVGFATSADSPLEDLASFGPTVLPAPSEVFELLFAAAESRAQQRGARRFDFAVASAMRWAGRPHPSRLDTVRRVIADKLVYRDLRNAMGGQVRYGLAVGAPVAPEVVAVFAAAGVTILDGSGLAELGAPAAPDALTAAASPR